MLMRKYPEQQSLPPSLPMPKASDVRIFRVVPCIVSVLDYTKGFGHTDLFIAGEVPGLYHARRAA